MKFLFVTYRWGRDLTGGAEIHHRRLVDDLVEQGHDVHVWTTTGREIPPVAHWGVDWQAGYLEGEEIDEQGVHVCRFPLDSTPRLLLGLGGKYLERRLEDVPYPPEKLAQVLHAELNRTRQNTNPELILWDGWHHPEPTAAGLTRWSKACAFFVVKTQGKSLALKITAMASEKKTLAIFYGETLLKRETVSGEFSLTVPLPELFDSTTPIRLETSALRPLKDHRTLGIYLRSAELLDDAGNPIAKANLADDLRSIGRRNFEHWLPCLMERAASITPHLCGMFDWLRGPRSKALKRALQTVPADVDLVVACNYPWAIIPLVAENCKAPWAAMALWHLEDEYYAWPHYLAALKKARFVLANTPFSAHHFFEPNGIPAPFVGPGIPPLNTTIPKEPSNEHRPFRVLTVCRKSGEKRYDLVIEAVGLLRAKGVELELTLIGPDGDYLPVPEWVNYRGRVDDAALAKAYAECSVFVLLSETESFGMVVAEAWLHGKPVIVNRHCGPVASLVNDSVDGFSVGTAEDCAERLLYLKNAPTIAQKMGALGKLKTEEHYMQQSATQRFLAAVEEFGGSGVV